MKLAAEPELLNGMVSQTKALLEFVGYQVDDPEHGYEAWLKSQAATMPS